MKKFGLLIFILMFICFCDNTANTVSLKVQNNKSTSVQNLKVGSLTFGLIASAATSAAQDIEKGSYSVSSDTGESGTVDIQQDSTLVIASDGSLSLK